MRRADIINAIMDAFEDADRKSWQNQALKDQIDRMRIANGESDGAERPRWAHDIYEYGRRAIWKKYAENYYSKTVTVYEDDDGNKSAQPFNDWYEKRFGDFPDFMSKEDFAMEFDTELHRRYDEELAKAMRED